MKILAAMFLFCALCAPSFAAEEKSFSDPKLEARAHSLQKQLRCLVCQGQSIDESEAGPAADLRQIIREHIAAGESDDQIKQFLVARFGDFILMQPPVRDDTLLLWFGPAALILLGGTVVAVTVLRAKKRERAEPQLKTGL